MQETKLRTGTKWDSILVPLDEYRYLIPKTYKKGMNVDAVVYSSPELIGHICDDLSLEQAANVAQLPGVVGRAMVMPDGHQGYGFPIGGVAAMNPSDGVVSPGGVGFDINCGVRLLAGRLSAEEVKPRLNELAEELFRAVPAGTGPGGRIKLSARELESILEQGSKWAVRNGYAHPNDPERTEDGGCLPFADPTAVSERAKKRGSTQLGTLGSGNHFLEVQYVDQIFEADTAQAFGLFPGQICFMTHCGSRGLGHQVCTDFVGGMKGVMSKYGITLPDRELACCPIESPEGKEYLSAMSAAANFAFANRQVISHWIREVVHKVFGKAYELPLLYDVAHNMAKFERHTVGGREMKLLVHRKGATRAFPAGRDELFEPYLSAGQPVIIPGDMGRASYVLVGTERALDESFGSVCHGAGRLMSRTEARKGRQAKDVVAALKARGVVAKATTREGLTEEVPEAYKPIDQVIDAVRGAGLAKPVARLRPLAVIKG